MKEFKLFHFFAFFFILLLFFFNSIIFAQEEEAKKLIFASSWILRDLSEKEIERYKSFTSKEKKLFISTFINTLRNQKVKEYHWSAASLLSKLSIHLSKEAIPILLEVLNEPKEPILLRTHILFVLNCMFLCSESPYLKLEQKYPLHQSEKI